MVKIQTIDELEAIYYGYNRNLLRKADAPVTTSTQGVFNAIFGAYAWAQLNLEANAFGIKHALSRTELDTPKDGKSPRDRWIKFLRDIGDWCIDEFGCPLPSADNADIGD